MNSGLPDLFAHVLSTRLLRLLITVPAKCCSGDLWEIFINRDDSCKSRVAPLKVPGDSQVPRVSWGFCVPGRLLPEAVLDSQREGLIWRAPHVCHRTSLPIKTFVIKLVEDGEAKLSFERWHGLPRWCSC